MGNTQVVHNLVSTGVHAGMIAKIAAYSHQSIYYIRNSLDDITFIDNIFQLDYNLLWRLRDYSTNSIDCSETPQPKKIINLA